MYDEMSSDRHEQEEEPLLSRHPGKKIAVVDQVQLPASIKIHSKPFSESL